MKTFTKHLRWLLASLMLLAGVGTVLAADETITFSSLYSSNTTLDGTAINGTNFSVTFQKRSGGTATQYYTNGSAVRWYGGGTMTIESSTKTIAEIVITYTQTANSVTADVGTYSLSNKVGTWTGSSSSVTFTQSGTTGHCRISSIAVTYAAATNTVATPTFTPNGATFLTSQEVTINCTTAGATILYSTDNGATWQNYTSALTLTATTTIQAKATKTGMDDSSVGSATFTKATVMTVAEAITYIETLGTITSPDDVYVSGIVSQVDSYNSSYKSITYWISDDGGTTTQMEVYSGKGLDGADFSSIDDLQVGDEVTIKGKVKMYNSTPEFTQSSEIVEFNRPVQSISFDETTYTATLGTAFSATLNNPNGLTVTYSSSNDDVAEVNATSGAITLVDAGVATITATAGDASAHYKLFVIDPNNGTETNPYTVADAIAYIGRLGTETSPVDIYVSGKVSQVDSYASGAITYWISDDGTPTTQMEVYKGKGLSGNAFTAQDNLSVNDEVTVCGKVKMYNSTPELDSGSKLVAHTSYTKQDPSLSYESTMYTITVGDAFTAPVLNNPYNLTVTYSTDGDDIGTLDSDGVLTLTAGATGTITVIATFAGDDTYAAGSASYTLIVNDKVINPNPKNVNTEYYVKVTDVNELEDGDAIILVHEDGTASVAMGTTETNGAYRGSYGLASNGKYDWENSTVQLSDEGKADIEKIVLVKEGDLFYLYATRTATLTGFLYANNYGLYVDSNNTNLADNHKAAISIDATGNASITFQGDTTKPLFGRTSSGWSSFASGTTLDNMQIYVERSVSTPATGNYVKVTSNDDLTDGEYLIVYEDEDNPVAFDGSREILDASGNTIDVIIDNNTIASSETVDAATFTIDVTNGTLQSKSGKYIGVSSNSNGLKQSDEADTYTNTFAIDNDNNAVITANFNNSIMTLRFNSASGEGNYRFRYYKNAGQQPIALYKRSSGSSLPSPELAWSSTTAEATLGKTFEAPTLSNPNSVEVTYESTDENVATINSNGEVSIEGAGTTTIKAIFAGNETYKAQTVSYTLKVKAPATGDDFVLVTNVTEIEEGDYLIVYDNGAMNTTVSNSRLQYNEVDPDDNNVIKTDDATIIWHIAQSGDYYTIYNAEENAYAASNGTKNQAQMLADGTDNKALWSVTINEGVFDFTNKANAEAGVNATLRRNGTYGFACYAEGTGGSLSLYKKVETVELVEAQDCYKTMAAPYDMDLTGSDLKAYIVTLNDEQNEADLKPIVNIPAGTPIILHANSAGSYKLEKAGTDFTADDVSENVLLVSNGKIEGDGTIFVLNKSASTGIGFYRLNNGMPLATGKCYLKIEKNSSVKFIGFNFDDVATGIETVESTMGKVQGTIYDLQGRRVTTPAHGLYIVNGKKVFIK